MSQLDNSSVLITGGTGSLGKALISHLLENTTARRIAIFSRDELKQYNLRSEIGENSRLRWFIGDVRDLERLKRALHGVDFVIHAAALKQVDTGEYNPMEFIKTNVLGSQNVIDASIDAGVRRVVALSTDKASSPINLYGATFSVVRYGNVMGSRGSVIPFWQTLANDGKNIPITNLEMTRFWISIEDAVNFVLDSLEMMKGGELYVPKIPSMKIVDLAKAVAPNSILTEVGMRPGEKLHEEMISADDSRRTIDLGKRYVVNPVVAEWGYEVPDGIKMSEGVAYQSHTNSAWMGVQDIANWMNHKKL
jgi:UDP-N-acetylglucosamine 4,6-dehydratase